ncbi:MerR family DNA-binding transcriptional regulator [Streptomyces chartreusis]
MWITMKIGELSSRTGVSVRLLRYYEEQGLLLS